MRNKIQQQFYICILIGLAILCSKQVRAEQIAQTQPQAASIYGDIRVQIISINDDPKQQALGNGDGRIQPGEEVILTIQMANYATTPVTDSILSLTFSETPQDVVEADLPALKGANLEKNEVDAIEFTVSFFLPATVQDITKASVIITLEDYQATQFFKQSWSMNANGTFAQATAAITQPTEVIVGKLEGLVIDAQTADNIVGANIRVVGTAFTTKTNNDGVFQLELAPGRYDVEISKASYKTQTIREVEVRPGQPAMVDVALSDGADTSIEEVIVEERQDKNKAAVQLDIRKKALVVSDALSAEQISRTGDSSAGGAVKRATGTSIIGGKYVYIRGLGERYSYSLLNGSKVPSPEPNNKVVPLDIFSASVLSNLKIIKTATAALPGDFAGGALLIETKEFPEERIAKITAKVGYNFLTTFQRINDYQDGRLDGVGAAGSERALPSNVPKNRTLFPGTDLSGNTLTLEDVDNIARDFNNRYALTDQLALLNQSYSVTYGNKHERKRVKLGYLAYGSYSNSFQRTEQIRRNFGVFGGNTDQPTLIPRTDFTGEVGEQTIEWNTLGNLHIELPRRQRLNYTLLYTARSDDEARDYAGFQADESANLVYSSLQFTQRSLLYQQLSGSHPIGQAELGWYSSVSLAKHNVPDWRELVRKQNNDGSLVWLDKSSSGSHFWSDLDELGSTAGIKAKIGFAQWRGLESFFHLGADVAYRQRDFSVRRFLFGDIDRAEDEHGFLPPDELFTDEQIGTNVSLREVSLASDGYEAKEQIYATYVMTDLPLAQKWDLNLGLRYEFSDISITTLSPFSPFADPIVSQLKNHDVLPSLNLVYRVTEKVNLRLSGSQTLARPDFREISPFALSSYFGSQAVRGNPDLDETKIFNADMRAEYFPSADEVLALSAFYKYFQHPIEQVIIPSGSQFISYTNALYAWNVGLELESRFDFGHITDAIKGLYTDINLTWLRSRAGLTGATGLQTRNKRPLQGQSDWLANIGIGYKYKELFVTQLSYNTFSKRIAQVGANGAPDIFELPFHDLVYTFSISPDEHWTLKFSVNNMLNQASRKKQGDRLLERDYQGVTTSLGAEYEF